MIAARELACLKKGAIVVNMARGGIVDDAALLTALSSDRVRGAVLDVYAAEPLAKDHPLRKAANVLLMPHMGASTHEAQRNVAVDVAEAVRDALLSGELSRSLNVASVSREDWEELQPSVEIAERAAHLARALLAARGKREIKRLLMRAGPGVISGGDLLLASATVGVLSAVVEQDRLNLINARVLAELRGVELSVIESDRFDHPYALEVVVTAGGTDLKVQSVAAPGAPSRITNIDGFHLDVPPRRTLIVLTNKDVPGVIGRVGTLLGEAKINIASYHQSRLAQGGDALAAISVDDAVPQDAVRRLFQLPAVRPAR